MFPALEHRAPRGGCADIATVKVAINRRRRTAALNEPSATCCVTSKRRAIDRRIALHCGYWTAGEKLQARLLVIGPVIRLARTQVDRHANRKTVIPLKGGIRLNPRFNT
ncbi:MAG: hypothetical protein KIT73_15425 [Burkholderiales bacterium]|nr:hypothetical protein [Burkholderiales bacterium]